MPWDPMDQPTSLEGALVIDSADTPITGGSFSAPGVDSLRAAPGQTTRPLLTEDTADPASIEQQFYTDSKKALQPGEKSALLSIEKTFFNNDLMNQPLDAAELPSLESVYAKSGSVGIGQSGGLLVDGDDGTRLSGSNPTRPANIGNPRVGEDTTLGTIQGGGTPAEAEEVLRKQILEAIRTEPSTRLDQSVAIPEIYQQVNPAAKLGFPIMQTRPQFAQDFVRGRLALPPTLTIKEDEARMAGENAYSHVDSLDGLKDIYQKLYAGKPPRLPEALLETTPMSAESSSNAQSLPSMGDIYPGMYAPQRSSRNIGPPGAHIPLPDPGTMAPLMVGGVAETVPDTFSGGAPGTSTSSWAVGSTGYAIHGAPTQRSKPASSSNDTFWGRTFGGGGAKDTTTELGGVGGGTIMDQPMMS